MSPLTMGTRRVAEVSDEQLRRSAGALSDALASGEGCLDPHAAAPARAVLRRSAERSSRLGNHTVVALAGATGSGKSSLFNELVGQQVAEVGARRPTTSSPTAAVWGTEPAKELLDWLEVERRHEVTAFAGDAETSVGVLNLDGLVLLDLPDFDSRVAAHRAEADRLLGLVDVFVWVTDPQKYADARLHEDYVSMLCGHGAVTMVVLNQGDRLTPEELAACRTDLLRLLDEDGVPEAEVLVTSASTGAGVTDLTFSLAKAVQRRDAARHRLMADLRSAVAALRPGVADAEAVIAAEPDAPLVGALGRAAGIPTVLRAVQGDHRREAWARTGWLFTRGARTLRPDRPSDRGAGVSAADVRAVLGRSSLPPATPAARVELQLAARDLGARAAQGLPPRWAEAVSSAVTPADDALGDALDAAVLRTPLRDPSPVWWTAFGAAQWVLAAAALAGLVWLATLTVVGLLRPSGGHQLELGGPAPALLLLGGGLVLGVLAAFVARLLAVRAAVGRRALVAERLQKAVAAVAREHLTVPVRAVLERHAATREHLEAAGG